MQLTQELKFLAKYFKDVWPRNGLADSVGVKKMFLSKSMVKLYGKIHTFV